MRSRYTTILCRCATRVSIQRRSGYTIVVDSKTGALGYIALKSVGNAVPDGYTVGFVWNSVLTTLPNTMKVPYTPDSYVPIIQIGYTSYVMCVASSDTRKTIWLASVSKVDFSVMTGEISTS